ncbi:NPCBM/NEW2 domain-containing protein [Clostridium sp. ZS2-4]|uniref:NPCBM/NEW2 domain-containing protein n=1 Tax=Clostridium sp. ZS2-4 TaxID=2987703 RepID=UPI00227D2854|nr:NPCBM/NEW2 domain-containing protein [Clostridium sp. ZS2-4]MCY6355045.1 NPCBM/NEW2 domain-containing protein [Clostridium sp. ZS2-4]
MKRLLSLTLIFSMILSCISSMQIHGQPVTSSDNTYNVSVSFDNDDVDVQNQGKLTYRGYDTENITDWADRSDVFKKVKYKDYISAEKVSSFDKHLKLEDVKYLYHYIQHDVIEHFATAFEICDRRSDNKYDQAYMYYPYDMANNTGYSSLFLDKAHASNISISSTTGISGEIKAVYDGNTYYSVTNYKPGSVMINENSYNYIPDENSTTFSWFYTYTAYKKTYQGFDLGEHNWITNSRENPKLFVSAGKIIPKTVFYDTGDFNNNQYIPYNRTEYKEASKFWGYLKVQDNANYKFRLVTKDNAAGYITADGKIDLFSNNNSYSLTNNKYYPIHLEYIYNDLQGGNFTMEYQKDNGAWTQVPAEWFYPSKATNPEEADGIFIKNNDLDIKIVDEDSGSELPLQNVPIAIKNSLNSVITPIDAKTDVNGGYKYNNLNVDNYTISVTAPQGYVLKRSYTSINSDYSKKIIIYLTKETWGSTLAKVESSDIDLNNRGMLNYRGYDTNSITNWDDRKDVFKTILYKDYLTTEKASSFDKHLNLEDVKYLFYYDRNKRTRYYSTAIEFSDNFWESNSIWKEAYLYTPNNTPNNTDYTSSFIDRNNASKISIHTTANIGDQTEAVYNGTTYYSTNNYRPSGVMINENLYNYIPTQNPTTFSWLYNYQNGVHGYREVIWGSAHERIYTYRKNQKLFASAGRIIPKTVFYDTGDFYNSLYLPYNRSEHKEASKFWGYLKLPETAVYKFRVATTNNVTYLSDMNWMSGSSGWGTIQKNKNIVGNPITLNEKTYEKGIGTHANSTIIYDLGGEYERFKSTIGLDDGTVREKGTIIFSVYADGNEIYKSGVFRCGTQAEDIDLDVSGIKELKLVVNCVDNNYYDWADWADARLIRSNNNKASGYITSNNQTESFSLGNAYDLNSDEYYPIHLEYLYNLPNGGAFKMEYQRNDGAWTEVPSDWFYPSKDSTPENAEEIFKGRTDNNSICVKVLLLDSNNSGGFAKVNKSGGASEKPIPNIPVSVIKHVTNEKISSQDAITDGEGKYVIPDVVPSDYAAFIKPPEGYKITKTTVEDGEGKNITFYLTDERLFKNLYFESPMNKSKTDINAIKGTKVKLDLNVEIIRDVESLELECIIEKEIENEIIIGITNLEAGDVLKGTDNIGQAVVEGNIIRFPNKVLSKGIYTVKLTMKLTRDSKEDQVYPIKVTHINAKDTVDNQNKTYEESTIFNINSVKLKSLD